VQHCDLPTSCRKQTCRVEDRLLVDIGYSRSLHCMHTCRLPSYEQSTRRFLPLLNCRSPVTTAPVPCGQGPLSPRNTNIGIEGFIAYKLTAFAQLDHLQRIGSESFCLSQNLTKRKRIEESHDLYAVQKQPMAKPTSYFLSKSRPDEFTVKLFSSRCMLSTITRIFLSNVNRYRVIKL